MGSRLLVKCIRHEAGTNDASIRSVGAKNTSQAVHGKLSCRSVPIDKSNRQNSLKRHGRFVCNYSVFRSQFSVATMSMLFLEIL